jgi:hypothetical protein
LEGRACPSTVAYWRFEEGFPYTFATGANSILDSSGNDLHGTPYGCPSYVPDVPQAAIPQTGGADRLSLDFYAPEHDRIFIPDDRLFRLTQSLTIEAFIKPVGPQNPAGPILFRGDDRGGLDPYYLSVVTGTTLQFVVEDAFGGHGEVDAPLPYLNQWLFVAGTLDGATGTMSLYIGAGLVNSTTTFVRPYALLDPRYHPGLGIGSVQSDSYPFYFNGRIDEVRLSDQALTPDQFLISPPSVGGAVPFWTVLRAAQAQGPADGPNLGPQAQPSQGPAQSGMRSDNTSADAAALPGPLASPGHVTGVDDFFSTHGGGNRGRVGSGAAPQTPALGDDLLGSLAVPEGARWDGVAPTPVGHPALMNC